MQTWLPEPPECPVSWLDGSLNITKGNTHTDAYWQGENVNVDNSQNIDRILCYLFCRKKSASSRAGLLSALFLWRLREPRKLAQCGRKSCNGQYDKLDRGLVTGQLRIKLQPKITSGSSHTNRNMCWKMVRAKKLREAVPKRDYFQWSGRALWLSHSQAALKFRM